MEQRLSVPAARPATPPRLEGCVLDPAPPSRPSFVVATEWVGDVPVVSLAGDLDLATAPALERALIPLCDAAGGPVIVDLARCTFIDLRGLRVLLAAQEHLERSKQPLALVVGQPTLLRVFQITRVESLFEFHASMSAAARVYDG